MTGPALKRFDANLRALQVADDADVPPDLLGDLAHACDARLLIGRRAVREVDAEHVGAREDQLLDDAGIVGRRTQRRDDLRAATDVVARAFGHQCGVVGTSYGSQSINLKSLTLVRVGPVFSKSPQASK